MRNQFKQEDIDNFVAARILQGFGTPIHTTEAELDKNCGCVVCKKFA